MANDDQTDTAKPGATASAAAHDATATATANPVADAKPERSPAEEVRARISAQFERDRNARLLLPVPVDGIPIVALVLTLLLPGLGHLFLGRWLKGLIIGAAINGMFFYGVYLGWNLTFSPEAETMHSISYSLQFLVGAPAVLVQSGGLPDPYPTAAFTDLKRFEFAMLYVCVAALLNVMVIIEVGWRAMQVRAAKLGVRPTALKGHDDDGAASSSRGKRGG